MDSRDFAPLRPQDREAIYVPPQKLRERGWRQMKKNRLALWGLAIVIVMTVIALFGPLFSSYSYAD